MKALLLLCLSPRSHLLCTLATVSAAATQTCGGSAASGPPADQWPDTLARRALYASLHAPSLRPTWPASSRKSSWGLAGGLPPPQLSALGHMLATSTKMWAQRAEPWPEALGKASHLGPLVFRKVSSHWLHVKGPQSLGQTTNWTGGVSAENTVPPSIRRSCFPKDVLAGGSQKQTKPLPKVGVVGKRCPTPSRQGIRPSV